ncbi:hypothetical protein [Lysinibacillus xylanilyticus]|uniref:hypothetical protein n=1 Tax=Lysinibacillus xylanilyticus TaxID=582475 RepID=UPI003CFF9903
MTNHLLENINPANENDYLEYTLFNELEDLYIAYGDRKETAITFVHIDRENQVFHFSPCTFSTMSLPRFYIFLTNPDLHHYILNELAYFKTEEQPKFVVYDLENVEKNLRVAHFEYSNVANNYDLVYDIGKIKQIGIYAPSIRELLKVK